MKPYILILLLSMLTLSTQALLAANAIDLSQPAANKSSIVVPSKATTRTTPSRPQTVTNPRITAPTREVKIPQNTIPASKVINLAKNKQLYLTNGKSIIKSGINGLSVIKMNGIVQSRYNHATLFEGINREVWINANGAKIKIGIFARIKTSNTALKPTIDIGATTQTNSGRGIKPITGQKPINTGPKVHVITQGTDGGQEGSSPGTSLGLGDDLGLEATDLVADPGPASLAPVSLSVTTDSVVATAVVTVNLEQLSFSLFWGTEHVEHISLSAPSLSTDRLSGKAKDVDGGVQYTFQYVFQAPGGSKIIGVGVRDVNGGDANTSKTVNVEARYKLSFYPVRLEFPEHLDSYLEEYSEIKAHMQASQGGNTFFDQTWRKSIFTNDSSPIGAGGLAIGKWRIEASKFSREVLVTDSPIVIDFDLTEEDGIGEEGSIVNEVYDFITGIGRSIGKVIRTKGVKFDTSSEIPNRMHPNDNDAMGDKSHSVTRRIIYNVTDGGAVVLSGEGKVYVYFSYDFKLIVPIDSNAPVATMQ